MLQPEGILASPGEDETKTRDCVHVESEVNPHHTS